MMRYSRYLTEHFKLPVAFVGTYPPQECGIATFTCDLSDAVIKLNSKAGSYIAAISDNSYPYRYNDNVRFVIRQEDRQSYVQAAAFINASNAQVVNIQHEFGIFG